VKVGEGGTSVSVRVGVGVNVDVGGTRVSVCDGVGVIEGVHEGGTKSVGVMVEVPVWVGVAVLVGV